MRRALQRIALRDVLPGLVGEEVHRVAGVMPQQVVRPAARLAERVHVGAAEEVGLHVHLQHLQLAGLDALVHPLVARIEAAGVARHGDQAGFLLHLHDHLGVVHRVGHRDLYLDVLARAHALHGLLGVHLGGRGQDGRLDAGLRQALREVGGPVRDAVLLGDFPGGVGAAARERRDLDARDVLHCFDVLDAERALPCHADFHGFIVSRLRP